LLRSRLIIPIFTEWYNNRGFEKPDWLPKIGQLSIKEEAAGKVRVFAMVDSLTQSVLKPLHD